MDKLTIEHIAPYLAYGLDGQFKLSDVVDIAKNRRDEVRDKTLTVHNVDFFIKYCKPILRPLSDLFEWVDYNDGHGLVKIGYKYGIVKDDHGDYCEVVDAGQCESPKAYIPLNCYNFWLFKHHFDVFGLIDKGLAIDINTLKGGSK